MNTPPHLPLEPIVYQRLAATIRDKRGVEGRRGILTIATFRAHTIERCSDSVCSPLEPGLYAAELGMLTRPDRSRMPAIRLLGERTKGRYYIHAANWAHQLSGCIAPGFGELADGVGRSRAAMEALFRVFGEFVDHRRLPGGVLIIDPIDPPPDLAP